MTGNLYIVAAPSGAGKTTLVRLLTEKDSSLRVSVSTTSRAPRPGEIDGREYHFVEASSFLEQAGRGEFLEWARVHGNYYGTSKRWIEEELAAGHDVLLEIDWQGAQQVRRAFPEAIGIFILPPTLDALRERLAGRGTDTPETVARRIGAAQSEMRHTGEFDYVIINRDLQQALGGLLAVVSAARLRYQAQRERHAALFEALLEDAVHDLLGGPEKDQGLLPEP